MLISVLIPVFNEEALVGTLLDRVSSIKMPDGVGMEIVIAREVEA